MKSKHSSYLRYRRLAETWLHPVALYLSWALFLRREGSRFETESQHRWIGFYGGQMSKFSTNEGVWRALPAPPLAFGILDK